MTTNPRTTTIASRAGQARQRDLQMMLQDLERKMQSVLARRVRHEGSAGRGAGLDDTEHAEAHVQEDIDVALIQMKQETLQRVREALARLEVGEYGYCDECDGEISERRLQALPFASRCTACEESHERGAARERRLGSPQSYPAIFADQVRP